MTEYQIYCNYLSAKTKANELDSIADSLIRSAESDENLCQGSLASGWQGDAMNIFRGKCSEVTVQRVNTAKELKKIAQTIRSVAERNYKTEMSALEIARKRSYGG